jgi:hypothetical protein
VRPRTSLSETSTVGDPTCWPGNDQTSPLMHGLRPHLYTGRRDRGTTPRTSAFCQRSPGALDAGLERYLTR